MGIWQVSKHQLTIESLPHDLTDREIAWLSKLTDQIFIQNKQLTNDWLKTNAMLGNAVAQKQNSTWLLNKMHRYGLWLDGTPPEITDSSLAELLKVMAPAPPSIILAQAILSSDWGRTDEAKLANNLFKAVCYKPECGMTDDQLPAHTQWRLFNNQTQSIQWFIENGLNQEKYDSFREARFEMMSRGTLMNGWWYRDELPTAIVVTITDYDLGYWDQLLLDEQ
jgi:uncharacterized FlgJ-related protein